MSSELTDENPDTATQEQSMNPPENNGHDGSPSTAEPLTLRLPDGSESVSDAILSHREMLQSPQENGLATTEEITHLTEAMESLSTEVQETEQQLEESRSEVDEVVDLLARQQQQIDELQSAVDSLAGILGTSTEWDSFDADATTEPNDQ